MKKRSPKHRLRARLVLVPGIFLVLLTMLFGGCRCGAEEGVRMETLEVPEEPRPITVDYDGRIRLVTVLAEVGDVAQRVEIGSVLEVPEGATLYLETWQRLDDYRVRFVDAGDRLVPFTLETGPVASRSGAETAPGGTWVRLTPTQPLVLGRSYALRIEPELGARVTDHEGQLYEDLSLEIRQIDDTVPEGSAEGTDLTEAPEQDQD